MPDPLVVTLVALDLHPSYHTVCLLQETTIEELKHQFIKQQDARGFVVDGFPRDIGQALTFEEQVRSQGGLHFQ